jgi:hypothetical protein
LTILDEAQEDTIMTDNANPIYTHIVDRGDDKRPAEAIIMESRVHGYPLTALCGYTWVPSRDPNKYPVCLKCMEMFEFAKNFRGF